jgi:uncharacterized protein YceK
MKPVLFLILALILSGCGTVSGIFGGNKKEPAPAAITPSDLRQARWVENTVAGNQEFFGKFTVTPGPDSVTVLFDMDLPPGRDRELKMEMRALKDNLTRSFKNANQLIYRFHNAELVE